MFKGLTATAADEAAKFDAPVAAETKKDAGPKKRRCLSRGARAQNLARFVEGQLAKRLAAESKKKEEEETEKKKKDEADEAEKKKEEEAEKNKEAETENWKARSWDANWDGCHGWHSSEWRCYGQSHDRYGWHGSAHNGWDSAAASWQRHDPPSVIHIQPPPAIHVQPVFNITPNIVGQQLQGQQLGRS